MGHQWVQSSPNAPLPANAVIGGFDIDGSVIYVGRARHEGDMLPCKIVHSKGAAYVAWGGKEHQKQEFEVLVGGGYEWRPNYRGGKYHVNTVSTGRTRSGEELYVGRCNHEGSLCVGKIHPQHGCLYIPFGGKEIPVDFYEVLIKE